MAIITCPKCPTKLRVPDGSTAAVRCPKCQTVFNPPKTQAQPAFEIVDDPAPPKPASKPIPKPAPRPASPPPPAPPPPTKAKAAGADMPFEFDPVEEDDEPKKKPKRVTARREDDDEDDDDDRPRKKRRRDDDDDDDDDRPRSRRRDRDNDDDEDEDDRPRKKKRRRDDDEEDDWAESGSKKTTGAGAAKTGMLMLTISLGLYLGTFALFGLFTFVSWLGGYIPSGVMIVPGLLGMANWITGAIGLGFLIAGPSRSRGLAIAAAAVAGVHLVMAFVVANNTDAGMFSPGITVQAIGIVQKMEKVGRLAEDMGKNPSEAKLKEIEKAGKDLEAFMKDNKEDFEEIDYYMSRRGIRDSKDDDRKISTKELNRSAPTAMRWADLSSQLGFFDQIMNILCYHSRLFSDYLLAFFAGALEVARIVLIALLIGSVAKALKRDDAAGKAKFGLIAVCIAIGVALMLALLTGVLEDSAKKEDKKIADSFTSSSTPQDFEAAQKKMKDAAERSKSAHKLAKNFGIIATLLSYFLYSGMVLMPALGAMQTMSAAASKTRYRRPNR